MAEISKSTPEPPGKAQSPSSAESALGTAVGARIQLETVGPYAQGLDGYVHATCSSTSMVVITAGDYPNPTYHVIPTSNLASFDVLSPPTNGLFGPALGLVSSQAQLARANAAISKAKVKATKINRAVDRATQDLFDALDKQFSARWKGKDIIVMDMVVVKSPGYKTEDCKVITQDGEGLLARVRKVLENERKRAAQRDGWKGVKPAVPNIMPAVPVPQAPRKGG